MTGHFYATIGEGVNAYFLASALLGSRTALEPISPYSFYEGVSRMITCVLDYVIDPKKTLEFEKFGRRWIELVEQHGGQHHGYFLPAEGSSDRALALFTFPSLAAYEQYRALFGKDPSFIDADRIRDESDCIIRYDRTFMRPLSPIDRAQDTSKES